MVKLLDIPETITYSLSNVKLILVTNNYFVEINEVIKGLKMFLYIFSGIKDFMQKGYINIKGNVS